LVRLIAAQRLGNSVIELITIFLIFILVLAIAYFTTLFVGNYQKNTLKASNIKVIETFRITSTKYYQIIKVGSGKCFLVAICKDNISVLGEVCEEDLNPVKECNDGFKNILDKFKKHTQDDKDDQKKQK